jgi:hypothetical protein
MLDLWAEYARLAHAADLVSGGRWLTASRLGSVTVGIVAVSALFLQWREKRKVRT